MHGSVAVPECYGLKETYRLAARESALHAYGGFEQEVEKAFAKRAAPRHSIH